MRNLKKNGIVKGKIVGKETINEKVYAHVVSTLGKILIEENELHDYEGVRDRVGLLLGADIEVKVDDNFNEELNAYMGSRKEANKILSKQLEEMSAGSEITATVIIVTRTDVKVNICGHDITIKAKDLKIGWVEDLREKIKVGQEIRAKLISKTPFLEIEVINRQKKFDADKYKIGSEYVGKIIGTPAFGIIVEIEEERQVLCHRVEWSDEPKIGEYVVIQISNIKAE